MVFCEVLHQLTCGHTMRRPHWEPGSYIKLYVNAVNGTGFKRQIYKCDKYSKRPYQSEELDLTADDWEIHE